MTLEHGSYLASSILRNLKLLKEIRTLSFSFSAFGTGISDHETSIAILLANLLYKTVDINELVWIYQALETWLDDYGNNLIVIEKMKWKKILDFMVSETCYIS